MNILYVYAHPDDESFGPAAVMHKQIREGHQVFLLTLTKGGATKQRHKFNYSIAEMGEVRYQEMQNVASTLGLKGMTVLDFPDSGLKEVDPRDLENAIAAEINKIHPQVVVSYGVYGVSGFHDHLVTHAVVKHAFVRLRDANPWLKRLAMITISEEAAEKGKLFNLQGTPADQLDAVIEVEPEDIEAQKAALDCYVTYKETIEASGIKDHISSPMLFEFFQESFDTPVDSLTVSLK